MSAKKILYNKIGLTCAFDNLERQMTTFVYLNHPPVPAKAENRAMAEKRRSRQM